MSHSQGDAEDKIRNMSLLGILFLSECAGFFFFFFFFGFFLGCGCGGGGFLSCAKVSGTPRLRGVGRWGGGGGGGGGTGREGGANDQVRFAEYSD